MLLKNLYIISAQFKVDEFWACDLGFVWTLASSQLLRDCDYFSNAVTDSLEVRCLLLYADVTENLEFL
jgi:hypothetical protein